MKSLGFLNICKIIVFIFSLIAPKAEAHAPHDIIKDFEIGIRNEEEAWFVIMRNNIIRSIDKGKTWTRLVDGLFGDVNPNAIYVEESDKKKIYLMSGGSLFKSFDSGDHWQLHSKLKEGSFIRKLASSQIHNQLYALDSLGQLLFYNQDLKNWEIIFVDKDISDFIVIDDELYLLTSNGELLLGKSKEDRFFPHNQIRCRGKALKILKSNLKINKNQLSLICNSGEIYDLNENQNKLIHDFKSDIYSAANNYCNGKLNVLVLNSNGVFKYSNKTLLEAKGLSTDYQAHELGINNFSKVNFISDNDCEARVLVAGFDGLFFSKNSGEDFKELATENGGTIVGVSFSPNYAQDHTIVYSTYLDGGYISSNRGQSWKSLIKADSKNNKVRLFDIQFSPEFSIDGNIFSSTWNKFIYTRNYGTDWSFVILPKMTVYEHLTKDSGAFENNNGRHYKMVSPNFAKDGKIFLQSWNGASLLSNDWGQTFKIVGNLDLRVDFLASTISADGSLSLLALTDKAIYQSEDYGKNWKQINNQPDLYPASKIVAVSCDSRSELYLLTKSGLYQSLDMGKTFSQIPAFKGKFIQSLALSPYYCQDQTFYTSTKGEGLLRSQASVIVPLKPAILADDQISFELPISYNSTAMPLVTSSGYGNGNYDILAFSDSRIFLSSDYGENWKQLKLPKSHYIASMLRTRVKSSIVRWIEKPQSKLILMLLILILSIGIFYCLKIRSKNRANRLM